MIFVCGHAFSSVNLGSWWANVIYVPPASSSGLQWDAELMIPTPPPTHRHTSKPHRGGSPLVSLRPAHPPCSRFISPQRLTWPVHCPCLICIHLDGTFCVPVVEISVGVSALVIAGMSLSLHSHLVPLPFRALPGCWQAPTSTWVETDTV